MSLLNYHLYGVCGSPGCVMVDVRGNHYEVFLTSRRSRGRFLCEGEGRHCLTMPCVEMQVTCTLPLRVGHSIE